MQILCIALSLSSLLFLFDFICISFRLCGILSVLYRIKWLYYMCHANNVMSIMFIVVVKRLTRRVTCPNSLSFSRSLRIVACQQKQFLKKKCLRSTQKIVIQHLAEVSKFVNCLWEYVSKLSWTIFQKRLLKSSFERRSVFGQSLVMYFSNEVDNLFLEKASNLFWTKLNVTYFSKKVLSSYKGIRNPSAYIVYCNDLLL